MNSCVLILTNSISGLYSFRKEVVKSICDIGYKVYISIPEDALQSSFFLELGCGIIMTSFNRRGENPWADIKLMHSYKVLMKQLNPTVVLTYTIKPNIYGGMAARLCKIPQLANVTGLGDAIENGGLLQKLSLYLYRMGIGKAQTVFFQNDSNRSFFIKSRIVDERAVLLPGSGVNLQYHTYQKYPVESGKIRFLFIGRIMKDKGVEELFETARIIKTKYPQTEFQIVGSIDNKYQRQIEKLVSEGIITYWGRQLDVRPFIGQVECTIMPSYHEGMSNVNLESAANGRPVITTNVPGCKETVDDGVTGYLVKPRDAISLVEAISRFIQLPYDQKVMMGYEARKKVEREFDRNIVVNTYLKEIEKIANV